MGKRRQSAYFDIFQLNLQAALYETDFRPVPLNEYIKVGNSIFDKKMDIIRMMPKTADLGGKDPDHITELCNEVAFNVNLDSVLQCIIFFFFVFSLVRNNLTKNVLCFTLVTYFGCSFNINPGCSRRSFCALILLQS